MRTRTPSLARLAGGLLLFTSIGAVASAGPFNPTPGPKSPDGTRATIDLVASQQMKNVGGSDGLGLCVFTSLQHAARWANIIDLEGFRAWMQRKPGGGYPQKVDQMLRQYCQEKGVPVPEYVQHTGGDEQFLELALKTGRCPCVTYAGRDDFYSGPIAHMVNLAHLDSTRAAIIDNNRPGTWLWMTRQDFLTRWRDMQGGWAVVFLAPPPPPYPSSPERWMSQETFMKEWRAGQEGGEPAQVFGQCGPGGCNVASGWDCSDGTCRRVSPQPLILPAPTPDDTDPTPPEGTVAVGGGWFESEGQLYRVSKPRGVYELATGKFRPLSKVAGKWSYGDAGALPAGVTVPANFGAPEGILTGVITDKVHGSPRYSLNGQECTRDEAHAALELADDSGRWHLSAVGDSAFLARVKADVVALGSDLRGKLHVQYYGPSAWQVSQYRLSPGVTLRKPAAGRVSKDLGSVATADYSAARLQELFETWPDGPTPKQPPPPPAPTPTPGPGPCPGPCPNPSAPPAGLLWVLVGVVGVIVLKKKPGRV